MFSLIKKYVEIQSTHPKQKAHISLVKEHGFGAIFGTVHYIKKKSRNLIPTLLNL